MVEMGLANSKWVHLMVLVVMGWFVFTALFHSNVRFFAKSGHNLELNGPCVRAKKSLPLVVYIDAFPHKRARDEFGCTFTRNRNCIKEAEAAVFNLEKYPSEHQEIRFFKLQRRLRSFKGIYYWKDLRRTAKKSLLTFGWCSEAAYSDRRPINSKSIMNLVNYSIYIGIDADFPFLLFHSVPKLIEPLESLLQKKKNHILFLSSNCHSSSGRETFVKSIMKFVDVDSVGDCLHTKDFPTDIRALEIDPSNGRSYRSSWNNKYFNSNLKLLERYKFRLTLPNSICDDYVTEKLMDCFKTATIPIYLGAPNGHNWDMGLIAGVHPAMIHVSDFDGFESLTMHLEAITKNQTLYMSYFEYLHHKGKWKRNYPKHIEAIKQKRKNARSDDEFVCKLTKEAQNQQQKERNLTSHPKTSHPPKHCRGNWKKYFESMGKNMSRWR